MRPRNRFEGTFFSCERKGHRAEDYRSAKKMEKTRNAPADKKGGDSKGKCYVCGSKKHFAHKHCGLCRSLKNWMSSSRNDRTGVACADRKEEWDSDSDASFHMSNIQAGMTTHKKVPAGTTVEVADDTILPVDGFGTVEMDLDQPGTTTEPVKRVSVGYVSRILRNLLSTRKVVEQ